MMLPNSADFFHSSFEDKGRLEGLIGHGRLGHDATGDLRALGIDRSCDIGRRDAEGCRAIRIQPDAH